MTKKLICIAVVVMILAMAAPAFAYYVDVLQARTGGARFTNSGLATSSGTSVPAPLAGWTGGTLTAGVGSYYAGDTTPVKYGEWSFTPGAGKTGYYDVFATWSNVTSAQNMNPVFTVHNAGADVVVAKNQTTGGGAWNLIASGVTLNAGTAYGTRLSTIGTGASGKRASFDAIAWAASAAGEITNTGIADGTTGSVESFMELGWAAGASTMFYNVYMGTTSGALDLVGANLDVSSTVFDLVGALEAGKTYYWRVDSGNIDRITQGAEYSFTTNAVPEPSSVLALATGFIGLLGVIRRKRA